MKTRTFGHDHVGDLLLFAGLCCFSMAAWMMGFAIAPWLTGLTVAQALFAGLAVLGTASRTPVSEQTPTSGVDG